MTSSSMLRFSLTISVVTENLNIDEEVIKQMFNDVKVLRDNRYSQANELHRRVQQVHEKWVNIRTLLQTKLINILNIHTNPDFKFLAECTEWVHQKLVSCQRSNFTNSNFFLSFFHHLTNPKK